MNNEFDVVIVGGGAAGVGAARRLAGSGLSTLLLEADLRLGGRAWTREIAGLPLDLGCGWLHSAEKNALAALAEQGGIALDKRRAAWGTQFRDLGFSAKERADASREFGAWMHRLEEVQAGSDRASDALDPRGDWNTYVQNIVNFISGGPLDQMSAADYLNYDEASTDTNWRAARGLGALIAGSFPNRVALRLATPVHSLELSAPGTVLTTPTGVVRARATILTVSTTVLSGSGLKLPAALDAWRDAARSLPLGRNEKMFLEIVGEAPFENETQVLGNPRARDTASYYIRPLGMPVIECFFGGEGARMVETADLAAAAAFALDQLAALFGESIRRSLRPRVISNWSRNTWVGGAYSYALPGQSGARQRLAQSFGQRVFFAGEATSRGEFSTAHGAYGSGVRAANEAVEALLPGRGRQAAGFTGGA